MDDRRNRVRVRLPQGGHAPCRITDSTLETIKCVVDSVRPISILNGLLNGLCVCVRIRVYPSSTSQPLTLILILTLIHVGCFTLCCFPCLCYKPISVTPFSPGVHITNTAHRTVCGNACGGGGVEWGGGGYGCCRRQGEKTKFKV